MSQSVCDDIAERFNWVKVILDMYVTIPLAGTPDLTEGKGGP